jgi:hypothetical protein
MQKSSPTLSSKTGQYAQNVHHIFDHIGPGDKALWLIFQTEVVAANAIPENIRICSALDDRVQGSLSLAPFKPSQTAMVGDTIEPGW